MLIVRGCFLLLLEVFDNSSRESEVPKYIGTLLRKVNGSSSFCKGPRTSKV